MLFLQRKHRPSQQTVQHELCLEQQNEKRSINLNKLGGNILRTYAKLVRFSTMFWKRQLFRGLKSCVLHEELRVSEGTWQDRNFYMRRRSKKFKTYHQFQVYSVPISYSSKKDWLEREDPFSPGAGKPSSSHIHELFSLRHILQVVMNMDYKLEPITNKNIATYFSEMELLCKTVLLL